MIKKAILSSVIGATFSLNCAYADLLAYWNFNDATISAATLSAPDGGTQAATASLDLSNIGTYTSGSVPDGNYGTFAGTTLNGVSGEVAGQALAVVGSGNNNHFVTFNLSMTGLSSLGISYSSRTSGATTGFTTQQWSYSTDGTSFTNFGSAISGFTTNFAAFTVDTSSLSVLDGASSVYLRLTFSGATTTTSNNRVDNVQIFTAVPEPHEYAIAIAGLLGVVVLMRRRRALQA